MKIRFLLLALMLMFSLSACKVTGVKGEIGNVKVEASEKSDKEEKEEKESGVFCPPGQAKKGNC